MCSAPSSSNLIASGNCTPGRWLSIVGIGEDGVAGLSDAARRMIANARAGGRGRAPSRAGDGAITRRDVDVVRARWRPRSTRSYGGAARPVAVLATGDPFHYGVGEATRRTRLRGRDLMPAAAVRVRLAASRLGWPLQHCALVTLHGRALEGIVRHLQPGARILALSWDGRRRPSWRRCSARAARRSQLTVLEAMGGPARTRPSRNRRRFRHRGHRAAEHDRARGRGGSGRPRPQPVRRGSTTACSKRRPIDQARRARGHAVGAGAATGRAAVGYRAWRGVDCDRMAACGIRR